jgi:uncharacterized protein with HEPN domain
MRRPDPRAFLFDIQRACQLITRFISGVTFQEYAADLKPRSAVERQLEIVGEDAKVDALLVSGPEEP